MTVSIVTLENKKQFLGLLHGYSLEQAILEFTSQISFDNHPEIWRGWTTLTPLTITRIK